MACCHRRRGRPPHTPTPSPPPSPSSAASVDPVIDRAEWLAGIRDRGEGPWADIPLYHGENPFYPIDPHDAHVSDTNILRWSSILHGLRGLRRLQEVYHNTGKHLQALGKRAKELSSIHRLGILRTRRIAVSAEIID